MGSCERSPPSGVDLWVSAPNIRLVKIKESEPGSQARKGKFIRGKREGDWPLRRTSILLSDGGLLIPHQ